VQIQDEQTARVNRGCADHLDRLVGVNTRNRARVDRDLYCGNWPVAAVLLGSRKAPAEITLNGLSEFPIPDVLERLPSSQSKLGPPHCCPWRMPSTTGRSGSGDIRANIKKLTDPCVSSCPYSQHAAGFSPRLCTHNSLESLQLASHPHNSRHRRRRSRCLDKCP